jgi:hypothetical protein
VYSVNDRWRATVGADGPQVALRIPHRAHIRGGTRPGPGLMWRLNNLTILHYDDTRAALRFAHTSRRVRARTGGQSGAAVDSGMTAAPSRQALRRGMKNTRRGPPFQCPALRAPGCADRVGRSGPAGWSIVRRRKASNVSAGTVGPRAQLACSPGPCRHAGGRRSAQSEGSR